MKIKDLICGISVLLSVGGLPSCDKDDKNDDANELNVSKLSSYRVTLYNQFSDKQRFFDVENDAVYSDSTRAFDLMFIYPEQFSSFMGYKCQHMIASSSSEELDYEMRKSGLTYEKSEDSKVTFWKLPTSFKSFMFDTLSAVESLKKIQSQCDFYYNAAHRSDCLYSDQFGWTTNDMFAFSVDKVFCVAKIVNLSPYTKGDEGRLVLEVKRTND